MTRNLHPRTRHDGQNSKPPPRHSGRRVRPRGRRLTHVLFAQQPLPTTLVSCGGCASNHTCASMRAPKCVGQLHCTRLRCTARSGAWMCSCRTVPASILSTSAAPRRSCTPRSMGIGQSRASCWRRMHRRARAPRAGWTRCCMLRRVAMCTWCVVCSSTTHRSRGLAPTAGSLRSTWQRITGRMRVPRTSCCGGWRARRSTRPRGPSRMRMRRLRRMQSR